MTLSSYLATRPELSDAAPGDVLAAYDDDPSNWQPVPSERILAWLGSNGLLARLNRWTGSHTAEDDAVTLAVYSGIEAVRLGTGNANAVVDVTPGSPHRQLLAAAVAVGAITADDADALIARGRPEGYVAPTEADVLAAREAIARDTALSGWREDKFHADAAAAAAVDADPLAATADSVAAAYAAELSYRRSARAGA